MGTAKVERTIRRVEPRKRCLSPGVSESSAWPSARLESPASLSLSRCRDRIEIFEEPNLFVRLKCQEMHAKPFFCRPAHFSALNENRRCVMREVQPQAEVISQFHRSGAGDETAVDREVYNSARPSSIPVEQDWELDFIARVFASFHSALTQRL